ncbi:hypothetical protein ACN27J_05715 [Solwaraspora sp. WMMB762]|uniref:sialidase family protein n=1 Tax=Solwaraspora sp. WMMB762 TaxID=3404120 RepID=UPI003B9454CE
MPDLRLTTFDRERISEAVIQPALDRLRARARRRRRTMIVAAALGLLLVALVAPGLAATVGRHRSDGPAPPGPLRITVWDDRTVVGVDGPGEDCRFRFTRSDDAGSTWLPLNGPDTTADCLHDADGHPVSRAVAFSLTPDVFLVGVGVNDHVSTDAGRTWRDATATARTVSAFPPGAQPVDCLTRCADLRPPVAVDPVDGTVYRLADPPTVGGRVYVAPDGAIWTAGQAGTGPGTVVAVSTDRGASWRVTAGPAGALVAGLAARDARQAFVLFDPFDAGGTGSSAARPVLWRTTDGARSWQDLAIPLPRLDQSALTVGDDGRLLVGGLGRHTVPTWTSDDDGTTFTAGTAGPYGELGALPGRLWVSAGQPGAPGSVTVDGTSWQSVPLPTE